MPITQKTVILNAFGTGSLERRTRTSASGKASDRWTVTLDAAPLELDFDTKALGKGPAEAIAAHLRARISDIGAEAAPSTQLKRKYAATALTAGKAWAHKRYAGGRIGTTPPNQTPRLFNDSGRFVKGLVANATRDNNWVINVAANRLNAALLGGESVLINIVNRLRAFVPEFGSAADTVRVPAVRRAIAAAAKGIVAKQRPGEKGFAESLREGTKELIKVAIQEFARTSEGE